jgi:hypothetical protein
LAGKLSDDLVAKVRRALLEPTRVTMIPAVIAIRRAGIWETRPSPTLSTEYTFSAFAAGMPFCMIPRATPPRTLMAVMMSAAMASPLTNFIAPSMAPCIWDSCSRCLRFTLALSLSSTPARTSASMLICFPGSASSVKRAPTSATRSAPFVTTRN